MSQDVDGLNAGYARAILEEYLENPEAVPSEWRRLFEDCGFTIYACYGWFDLRPCAQEGSHSVWVVERPA